VPGVDALELFQKLDLQKGIRRRVKERLKVYLKDPHAVDLLDRMLTLDPSKVNAMNRGTLNG
jgi:cyclin-dependent kinase 9